MPYMVIITPWLLWVREKSATTFTHLWIRFIPTSSPFNPIKIMVYTIMKGQRLIKKTSIDIQAEIMYHYNCWEVLREKLEAMINALSFCFRISIQYNQIEKNRCEKYCYHGSHYPYSLLFQYLV